MGVGDRPCNNKLLYWGLAPTSRAAEDQRSFTTSGHLDLFLKWMVTEIPGQKTFGILRRDSSFAFIFRGARKLVLKDVAKHSKLYELLDPFLIRFRHFCSYLILNNHLDPLYFSSRKII